MRKIAVLLLSLLLLAGLSPVPDAHAAQSQLNRSLGSLWIDMAMGGPLIEWFNQNARPDDIARIDVWDLRSLDQITAGRTLVVFKSVAEAEEVMPRLADKIDIIGYNLEHGPANPSQEQADPVGSVQRMREIADQYGKTLALGPDRRFAQSDGVAMAPYVDMFVLQVQRVQTEPETVLDFTVPLIQQLRAANPDLNITVQVRTEGDVSEIVDLLDSLKEHIDGVSILTSPDTVSVAEALVAELRSREPEAVAVPGGPLEDGESPGVRAAGPAEPPAESTPVVRPAVPPPGPPEYAGVSIGALLMSALIGGLIGGGIVGLFCLRLHQERRPSAPPSPFMSRRR